MRAPVHGDAFECRDTGAVFSVVGVRVNETSKRLEETYHVVMVCVVQGSVTWGNRPQLGDMHHVGGTWRTLQDGYTLLTA